MNDAIGVKRPDESGSRMRTRLRRGVIAACALAAAWAWMAAWTSSAAANPQQSKVVGNGPSGFKDMPQPPAVLVGFTVTIGPFGPTTIVRSVRPNYLTADGKKIAGQVYGKGRLNVLEVVARDGYAVGAIVAKGGDRLDGFRVIFMRHRGNRLDPADRYESRWFGGRGGCPETQLGGDGRPVVGIHGRCGKDVDAIGLIQDDLPKIGAPAERTAKTPSAPNVLFLERPRSFFAATAYDWSTDPLTQELARQAFLIAGREELGLTTRDARLGDAMPAGTDDIPMEVSAAAHNGPFVEVLRGPYPQQEAMHHAELPAFTTSTDFKPLAVELERQSRGAFAEALRRAGFHGKPPAAPSRAPVPEEVAKLLGEMTCLAQFEAVRTLHELIRTSGESPQRCGALVRGYANLGILTELHSHPAHHVFKARALLYAQRALVRDNNSAVALQHRAYALAAAGLNGAALEDLAAAEKQLRQQRAKAGSTPADPPPPWVKIIDAYCRYDVSAMESVKDKDLTRLAGLWCFRACEHSGCAQIAIEKGSELVKTMPECCRLSDGLSRLGGVRLGHQSTMLGITAIGKTMYARFAAVPGLPAEAAQIAQKQAERAQSAEESGSLADEFQARASLIAALQADRRAVPSGKRSAGKAGKDPAKPGAEFDDGEPSWAALGCLIWEQAFTQIWRRVYFESASLGISPAEFLSAAAPLLTDHPYRAMVEVYSWNRATQADATRRLADISADDFEIKNNQLSLRVYAVAPNVWGKLFANPSQRTTKTDLGFVIVIPGLPKAYQKADAARELLQASPHSPFAQVILIEQDWNYAKDRAAAWEKTAGRFPAVLKALGNRYSALKKYADAERCLKAAIELAPSHEHYVALAEVYKSQGKLEQWQSTLEEYLNQPDYGLSHASVCNQLAQYFMSRRQWEKALPYAEGAAQSYSAWGLATAALCHEGLGHWKEAESLYQAVSGRYSGMQAQWYFFCKRSGRGDLESARQLLLASTAPGVESPAVSRGDLQMAVYHLLEKQPEKALPLMEAEFRRDGNPYAGLFVVLLCDELKKDTPLGAALEQIKTRGPEYRWPTTGNPRPELVALGALLAKDREKGGKADIDIAAADRIVQNAHDFEKPKFCYFLGKYFSLHGRPGQAVACWKKCIAHAPAGHASYCCTLALFELRKRAIDPLADEPPPSKPASDAPKAKNGAAQK